MVKLDEVETDCHQVFANDGTKSLKLIESTFLREKFFLIYNTYYDIYIYLINVRDNTYLTWCI